MKRLLDIVIATLMVIPLIPLFVIVGIVLKFTGERQAFFIQPRVGRGGRKFGLIKFVTMVANSENLGSKDITLKNDPRVLPIGRVLRKTKINELPQLFNVLKGDMSIVGWRPLLQAGFDRYSEEVKNELIKIQPGLTGIGSIVFRDEERILDQSDKPFDRCYQEDILPYKGELEKWYIHNQSVWLDLKIILCTAIVILLPSSRFYLRMFPGLPVPVPGSEVDKVRQSTLQGVSS